MNESHPSLRKVIHVDMDCFFAAVEIRDQPRLRGRPIAVGSPHAQRGVLCTASYEARAFGVRAAMPNVVALRKCPQLEIVPLRMGVYQTESRAIMEIFSRFTSIIQPLSLDEAFLDVSECPYFGGSATLIAQEIMRLIQSERHLSASAGVAPNKFLAKIASDLNKPAGLFTLAPHSVDDFVRQLPVQKIWGVGPKTAERLESHGFYRCGDLQQVRLIELEKLFGRMGERLFKLSRGIDDSPVNPSRSRKSFSKERTFAVDQPREYAWEMATELFAHLQQEFSHWISQRPNYKVLGLEFKMRFFDFFTTTVHHTGEINLSILRDLVQRALLRHPGAIRLVGVGFQLEAPRECQQLEFDF